LQLSEIRQQFATLSGRHDLVADFSGDDFDDNGADWFLDCGQRWLDRKATHKKMYSWYKEDITAGDYKLNFRYCTAVKEVWVMGADTDRAQLSKKDYNWMRSEYAEGASNEDQGVPKYYSPIVLNLGPDQIALTSSDYTDEFTYDADEILFSDTADHILYHGILFMPPSDRTLTVSVLGRFWSPPLYPSKADTLKTYWTVHHPDILILAALYSLEGFYRNREGQRDYREQLVEALVDIDAGEAEEEVQDASSMEG